MGTTPTTAAPPVVRPIEVGSQPAAAPTAASPAVGAATAPAQLPSTGSAATLLTLIGSALILGGIILVVRFRAL